MNNADMEYKTKRNITKDDLQASAILRELWEDYRASHPDITQQEAAQSMGLSQSMFNMLKNGKVTWNTNHILKVAHFFGVSIGRFNLINTLSKTTHVALKEVEPSNIEAGPDVRGKVPVISWVQAGNWYETIENFNPADAEEWLICPFPHGNKSYVLRVRGESMFNPQGNPSFNDGDLIFVDPDRYAGNGSLVIVRLDDESEATFKKLVIEGDQRYLRALNPSWPTPVIRINGNATISGVVFGKWVPL